MKALNDADLLKILQNTIVGRETIEDSQAYQRFLEDLGGVVADHFGGAFTGVKHIKASNTYICSFEVNDSVPEDGGVFAEFDQDVKWRDGEEVKEACDSPGM
jgi:hypothetical protein